MNATRLCSLGLGLLAGAVLLAGCPQPPPLPPPLTLAQVVEQADKNNDQLPWLRGSIRSVGGEVVDKDGKPQNLDILGLAGLVRYAQPNHLFMSLSKAEQPVMGLGSNDKLYWMWVAPPNHPGKCWVGSYQDWNPAVGGGAIPIHPRLLTQLLAIDSIPPDLHGPPWPILRVSEPKDRAYILTFLEPIGRRLVMTREVWIDRDPPYYPRAVRLFNSEGQVVMESELKDWRPVLNSTAVFPHDVDIHSINIKPVAGGVVQESGSRLRLRFAAVQVDDKFDPAKNPGVYEFRCPPEIKIVPLDPAASQAATGEID